MPGTIRDDSVQGRFRGPYYKCQQCADWLPACATCVADMAYPGAIRSDWYALARPAVAQEAREAHRTWYTEAWRREAAALIRGRLAPVASFLDGLATFDQREELAALVRTEVNTLLDSRHPSGVPTRDLLGV
jgi:hypothetical protein